MRTSKYSRILIKHPWCDRELYARFEGKTRLRIGPRLSIDAILFVLFSPFSTPRLYRTMRIQIWRIRRGFARNIHIECIISNTNV